MKDEGGEDETEDEDEPYQPSDAVSEEESSEEDIDESNWSAENESSGQFIVSICCFLLVIRTVNCEMVSQLHVTGSVCSGSLVSPVHTRRAIRLWLQETCCCLCSVTVNTSPCRASHSTWKT